MSLKIEIYTTARCPYCIKAKALLDQKGVKYTEIHVDQEEEKFREMLKRSNGLRTVPQIFINDYGIGGFDALWKLEQKKQLDALFTC
ncbi:glutaredoxin 3 [Coxiella endosymbiont of Amblyomma nuttalli]|uniref:glutaredoxin 3 n=1 Tax=Coxiella endosymbiont of Amblyomma nuttalli TaxID=2749996 RepID=UPI001BA9157E|nr:glutaredoxin 3 [Coxiella endosymbiont of Amblyomma nuttalli]QTS83641.1 Glutaredoxin-3 [Coxiella endosymbiont of Amblyomma nuttalli]